MLYKLTLGLFATAVMGEELAAPRRRYGIYDGRLVYARSKTDSGEEMDAINLDELSKRELIRLNKDVTKKLMKVKRKMKRFKEECARRRQVLVYPGGGYPTYPVAGGGLVYPAHPVAPNVYPMAAEGEGDSKKEGKKMKYRKMSKEELIELVSETAMDVGKAKKRLRKLKKNCD